MISKVFSARLRQLRKANNLTLEQVGQAIGMRKSSLSDIENCKQPISFDAAIRLADFFDVSIDFLLGRTDNPKSHKS
ncbi:MULTISPECIES: helix-turn-helix domain-containing protein [Desulfofundulus]|uniref:XRE family transcriptional regulator n=1 Tax=Desulfofundulus salinus TaxID=2419843 RepID=A0A494WTS3_9FIRM|nr:MULTISPECIES: helix-turn-helix transcriptional regulator [Desulfofundulus]NHM28894.1 helix-turn-helix transcriptional regulator [Desulfofundulus sp. TPOSR]RKO66351.1 XRE family transcriptional regulator [Desulfofundulus salinum]